MKGKKWEIFESCQVEVVTQDILGGMIRDRRMLIRE